MAVNNNPERIKEAASRAIERIYPSTESFEKELASGRRLTIYHGIDPTSAHLHIGHLIPLLILRRLQDLGHEIIFLIGDFTARIGDPTDKAATRRRLSAEEVKTNFTTFKKQASRIIKFSGENKARVAFNSKWLAKMPVSDFLDLADLLTVQQMIARDMFQERMKSDKPISLREFMYPLLQGYDSVALEVDAEVGGNDQTFNMLVGRDLLRTIKSKEKFVIAGKLLVDPTTGKKLGKTEGPLVNLDDAPTDMFGKIMALGDGVIGPIMEYCTTASPEEVVVVQSLASNKPRDAKLKAAEIVVGMIYGKAAGKRAKREFLALFADKQKPENIPSVNVGAPEMNLTDLLVAANLAPSKSEARRLIEQGAVKINDEKKTDPTEMISLSSEILLQVGPRRFAKVKA